MQKQYRIRKNGQFQYVYRKGKSSAARELVLLYIRAAKLQVGFSVSKKVGNAVTRNKVKRRLRAIFSAQLPFLRAGFYVVAARSDAAQADYKALQRSMRYLLNKQRLFKETP